VVADRIDEFERRPVGFELVDAAVGLTSATTLFMSVAPFVSGTGCGLLIVGQTQPGSVRANAPGDSVEITA